MDTLHTTTDNRPTVTVMIDTAYDLRTADLLEQDHPHASGNENVSDEELDARTDRNEKLCAAYEALFLAALTKVGQERDITVQATWDQAAIDAAHHDLDGAGEELLQSVYQDASDRVAMDDARRDAGLTVTA